MNRALLLAPALLACVPLGSVADEPDPRGGLEATLAPSDATKGIPFTTRGGWTVTVEQFALYVQVQAAHIAIDGAGVQRTIGGGAGEARFMVPGPTCSLRITGIDAGLGGAQVELENNSLGVVVTSTPCNVDDATLARFHAPAQFTPYSNSADFPIDGPSIIVRAHAEKDGQRVDLDLAFASYSFTTIPTPIAIVANKGITVPFPVEVEELLDSADPLGVTFDDMVAADTDGDGHITADELALNHDETCEEVGSCDSLFDRIVFTNTSYLFGFQNDQSAGQ